MHILKVNASLFNGISQTGTSIAEQIRGNTGISERNQNTRKKRILRERVKGYREKLWKNKHSGFFFQEHKNKNPGVRAHSMNTSLITWI